MVISSNNIIRQLSVPWATTKVLLSGENKKKIYTSLILTQKNNKDKAPIFVYWQAESVSEIWIKNNWESCFFVIIIKEIKLCIYAVIVTFEPKWLNLWFCINQWLLINQWSVKFFVPLRIDKHFIDQTWISQQVFSFMKHDVIRGRKATEWSPINFHLSYLILIYPYYYLAHLIFSLIY